MPVNTAALKTFAPAMRRQLLEAVGRKLDLLLHSQTPDTLSTYARQIAELREQETENREQLMERVAYTWFNRLCALRYLDARGWHPFGCKVLMPAAEGDTQPELLKLMRAGSLPTELKAHTNEDRLHGLLDGQIPPAIAGADPQGEVYRELVLASCRFYHQIMPDLFEELDDSTELLLPDDVLSEASVTADFKAVVSDDDCQDIEILGWLYQFYILEKKEEVMARKKAVPSEDIPAVTQLFTPHWIVRYMVENSLGRLWLRSKPNSGLKAQMPYFVDEPENPDSVTHLTVNGPEEIKLLDPACGSGHLLTYAFDLLAKIYEEAGYQASEIPEKILEYNLFGLEICPRAAQLAQFALICKSREVSRNAFRRATRPRVVCLRNAVISPSEIHNWTRTTGTDFTQEELSQIHQFRQATDSIGSLLQPALNNQKLSIFARKLETAANSDDILIQNTHQKLLICCAQAEMLSQRYHVVVENPPYLAKRVMNAELRDYLASALSDYKADTFSAFFGASNHLLLPGGFLGMLSPNTWLYLSAHEQVRAELLGARSLTTLLELPLGAIEGATVQVCASISEKTTSRSNPATFIRLTDLNVSKASLSDRFLAIIESRKADSYFERDTAIFKAMPGRVFGYWEPVSMLKLIAKSSPLRRACSASNGIQTGNNARFVRLWHEVSSQMVGEDWIFYNKGGEYRKWYGNNYWVVNWKDDGREIRSMPNSCIRGEENYFRQGLTWSYITSSDSSFRWFDRGALFDAAGPSVFADDITLLEILSFLNTPACARIISMLNPTLNFQVGDFLKIPFESNPDTKASKAELALKCIELARADWDSRETSINFLKSPVLACEKYQESEASARSLSCSCLDLGRRRDLSTSLILDYERQLSAAWGQDLDLPDQTNDARPQFRSSLLCNDTEREVRDLLSYIIGCAMGRFSLDRDGLIIAIPSDCQASHHAAYEEKVGKPIANVQFKPDPDAIIPVLDGEWFEDDIVARTREFLEVTFPESTVTENLRFIEESLGKDIRKYFCSDFYKDHLQIYKKRPIYWLVQSPKKGFACLIYLHRYTKDTLNQVLNNYFRPYLQKLEARLAQLGLDQLNDDLPTRERTAARKEAEKITKVLKECQAWEQDALLPLAQQRIELDLDDGVKVNYLKLQDVLAPIPGLAAKED